jgi:uncharacterized protein YbjT (DUF2867 family)
MKIIITGATGMVGEGVLLECLENDRVEAVLSISRRSSGRVHPKLKEYLVPEFLELNLDDENLRGYDGCFFCAGVSSVGMKEADYTRITYDTTIHFARAVLQQNPQSTFIYVSGTGTDGSGKGRMMWARVKGRTENTLSGMPFKQVFNFRPGFMKAMPGQKNILTLYKYTGWAFPLFKALLPGRVSTLKQVGRAMINAVWKGYPKQVLEVKDINALAGQP